MQKSTASRRACIVFDCTALSIVYIRIDEGGEWKGIDHGIYRTGGGNHAWYSGVRRKSFYYGGCRYDTGTGLGRYAESKRSGN